MQYRLTFPASAPKPAAASHPLTDLAGWTLIAALAYAPAALGCVRPGAITGLEILLTIAGVFWLAGCFAEKRRPRIPPLCTVLCGLIVAEGVGAVLAASPRAATSPGVVSASVMADLLLRVAALLGALLLTADLTRSHPKWSSRLWWAMALTGASVSLFGLCQKAGLTDLAARHMESNEGIYFATFNYHGNAGAFLNIAVPLCAGLLLTALPHRRADPKAVLVPALLLLLCVAGALANVSRAAQAILGLLLALFCAAVVWRNRSQSPPTAPGRHATLWVVATVLLTLVTAAALFRGSESARRWGTLGGMVASDRNARSLLAKVTVPMAEEAGAWGSGPGSYKVLFPRSRRLRPELYANFIVTEYVPGRPISMWSNAHNDYLQTVIEWGWVGSLAWGVLLLLGLSRLLLPVALPLLRGRDAPIPVMSESDIFRFSAGLALLGMCVHALVDFPFQIASLQIYGSVLLGIAWQNRPELPELKGKFTIISRLLSIL